MNDSTNLSADQQSSAQPDLSNQALTPAKPSTLRKIFIGADGLRALWSLLLFHCARLYENKKEVLVYDYADVLVPMLARMYKKRLAGYSALGYVVSAGPSA